MTKWEIGKHQASSFSRWNADWTARRQVQPGPQEAWTQQRCCGQLRAPLSKLFPVVVQLPTIHTFSVCLKVRSFPNLFHFAPFRWWCEMHQVLFKALDYGSLVRGWRVVPGTQSLISFW
jgi:hypothetical protein